ncbi:hypothetical protein L6452_44678 [Arctium lappa]|uniref:Uncharacterized protein n=1 Tax=Arctium lappa TaxID=4217 RepID=A0ACB8XKG4_ARCLA|nr:hypothetical protein L6452_44678 [Arctium lappa]
MDKKSEFTSFSSTRELSKVDSPISDAPSREEALIFESGEQRKQNPILFMANACSHQLVKQHDEDPRSLPELQECRSNCLQNRYNCVFHYILLISTNLLWKFRQKLASEYRGVWTADELTQMIQRHLEERKVEQSDITGLSQLEKEIDGVLQQVRTRKTQLMLGAVKVLQEEQKQLRKEKQSIVGEIMAAKLNQSNVDD